MCDVPLVTTCNGETANPNSGGEIYGSWKESSVDLVVGNARRDGCTDATVVVDASGRAGSDSLLASFSFSLADRVLTVLTADIEVYPGENPGGDLYSLHWTDPGGTPRSGTLTSTLDRGEGWWLYGSLTGTLLGLGELAGESVDLTADFSLRTISETFEEPCGK